MTKEARLALLRNIGKLFGRIGDDVGGALKRLWGKNPNMAKAMRHDALEDIPDAVHKAKLFRGKIADDITTKVRTGKEGIVKELNARSADIKNASMEYGRSGRALRKTEKGLNDARRNRDYHSARGNQERAFEQNSLADSLEADLARQREEVLGLKSVLDDKILDKGVLANYYTAIKTSPQSAMVNIKTNAELQGKFPSLGGFIDVAENSLVHKNQIINSVSGNLGNDAHFVKEYLKKIHPNLNRSTAAGGTYANNWMANPKNTTKLEELMSNNKFRKFLDIDAGSKAAREAARGLSRSQMAKMLGVPVASIALTAGPMAVMSWFDAAEGPTQTELASVKVELDGFNASDLGQVIKRQTEEAMANIDQAFDGAAAALSIDPANAAEATLNTILTNKAVIDKNLTRWNSVIRSSDDADQALKSGRDLQKYSHDMDIRLAQLESMTGEHLKRSRTPGVDYGLAGNIRTKDKARPAPTSANIKAIQSYLGERFQDVAPTGQLDRPTVKALRVLEREFDTLGETGRFTQLGLLVKPEDKHVIELKDLKNLERILRK